LVYLTSEARDGERQGVLVRTVAGGEAPARIRVDAGEVRIRRRGRAIVLEPVPESWDWLDTLAGEVDEDFESAVREQPEPTERPGLRKVFR
jgi:antitoxin VapB